jgi:hypothetical protein
MKQTFKVMTLDEKITIQDMLRGAIGSWPNIPSIFYFKVYPFIHILL